MTIKVMNDNTLLVIKSDHSLENIKNLEKQDPSALCRRNEDGDPLFTIAIAKNGEGRLNSVGAEFAPVAGNDGKAKITITLPVCDDVREYIADKYGAAITYLVSMDSDLGNALTVARNRKNQVLGMINIVE